MKSILVVLALCVVAVAAVETIVLNNEVMTFMTRKAQADSLGWSMDMLEESEQFEAGIIEQINQNMLRSEHESHAGMNFYHPHAKWVNNVVHGRSNSQTLKFTHPEDGASFAEISSTQDAAYTIAKAKYMSGEVEISGAVATGVTLKGSVKLGAIVSFANKNTDVELSGEANFAVCLGLCAEDKFAFNLQVSISGELKVTSTFVGEDLSAKPTYAVVRVIAGAIARLISNKKKENSLKYQADAVTRMKAAWETAWTEGVVVKSAGVADLQLIDKPTTETIPKIVTQLIGNEMATFYHGLQTQANTAAGAFKAVTDALALAEAKFDKTVAKKAIVDYENAIELEFRKHFFGKLYNKIDEEPYCTKDHKADGWTTENYLTCIWYKSGIELDPSAVKEKSWFGLSTSALGQNIKKMLFFTFDWMAMHVGAKGDAICNESSTTFTTCVRTRLMGHINQFKNEYIKTLDKVKIGQRFLTRPIAETLVLMTNVDKMDAFLAGTALKLAKEESLVTKVAAGVKLAISLNMGVPEAFKGSYKYTPYAFSYEWKKGDTEGSKSHSYMHDIDIELSKKFALNLNYEQEWTATKDEPKSLSFNLKFSGDMLGAAFPKIAFGSDAKALAGPWAGVAKTLLDGVCALGKKDNTATSFTEFGYGLLASATGFLGDLGTAIQATLTNDGKAVDSAFWKSLTESALNTVLNKVASALATAALAALPVKFEYEKAYYLGFSMKFSRPSGEATTPRMCLGATWLEEMVIYLEQGVELAADVSIGAVKITGTSGSNAALTRE